MNDIVHKQTKKPVRTSIQKQLFKVITRTLLFTLLILGGTFSAFNIWNTLSALTKNAEEIVHGAAIQLIVPVLFQDKHVINEVLSELKMRRAITEAKIYPLYNTVSSDTTFLCPQLKWTSRYFIQCEAIQDKNGVEAYLAVTFSRESVLTTLLIEMAVFIAILMLAYGLALFYARGLSKKLTAPLRELSEMSEHVINKNDFSVRAKVETYHEVAALSQIMNRMFAEIELRNDETRRYGEKLEDKVSERTASLQLAIKEAINANLAKSEFLANMSHELRTPLHGILSFSKFGLKRFETAEPEKLAEYFGHIENSGNRLLSLLDDLLDLAKFESGKMEMHKANHDLRQVAEKCLSEQQARLEDNNLQVSWSDNSSSVNARGIFDDMKVTQVIANLLSNAIKFSPANAHIILTIEEVTFHAEAALQFSLIDEGVGIPKGELKTVFDKFIQSSKTKTGAGGTGLGLAICNEIIEYHDGVIWAESPETGGAIFSFIIPTTL